MVKLSVKVGVHYTKKENNEIPCLICQLRLEEHVVEWKDFKQKLFFDIDMVVTEDNLNYVEGRGWNIDGFILPWQIQYLLIDLKDKGLLRKED